MIRILSLLLLIIFQSCSKPKTVLICGDHVCINKNEAKQYFEENLSLEVKIININEKKNIDLVELNLRENKEQREVTITKKEMTNKKIRALSKKEVKEINDKIKKKKKKKIISNKQSKKNEIKSQIASSKNKADNIKTTNRKETYKIDKSFDVCKILDQCNIDEISKYLIKVGEKKSFPDITIRE